jgi:hypothetical protein
MTELQVPGNVGRSAPRHMQGEDQQGQAGVVAGRRIKQQSLQRSPAADFADGLDLTNIAGLTTWSWQTPCR